MVCDADLLNPLLSCLNREVSVLAGAEGLAGCASALVDTPAASNRAADSAASEVFIRGADVGAGAGFFLWVFFGALGLLFPVVFLDLAISRFLSFVAGIVPHAARNFACPAA